MARQVMTGGAAWQGRMKQQTMQAYVNEIRTGDTVVGDMVRVLRGAEVRPHASPWMPLYCVDLVLAKKKYGIISVEMPGRKN